MSEKRTLWRREWLRGAGLVIGTSPALLAQTKKGAEKKKQEEEDVSPGEDLMREHGVLKRVLLVYREVMGRIDSKKDYPPDVVVSAAGLIRAFVEDYHEKLEEDYLFPRFRKANQHVDLVEVLYQQHQKGRTLTDRTLQLAKDASKRADLRATLAGFVRMYEPHEAREDTVLFPAFHKLVSEHEWDALGEEFEKKENQIFHGDGFEKNVDAVTKLEMQLGIYDLSQFTPKV
jgi:hemerythrin-like domain-containing protein